MSNNEIKFKIDEYIDSLNLVAESDEDRKKALEELLKISLDCRNNEINRYWSRSSYFFVYISGLFITYFTIFSLDIKSFEIFKNLHIYIDTNLLKCIVLIFISILGVISSVTSLAVMITSKYWRENWEFHAQLLSMRLYGDIFGVVNKSKELYSISKANYLLNFIILVIWYALALIPALFYFGPLFFFLTFVVIGGIIFFLNSYLSPKNKSNSWCKKLFKCQSDYD